MNALQTLISETAKSRNLSRTEIVQLVGYKNTSKGLRRLDHFLATLEGQELFKQLPTILGIRDRDYAHAVKAAYDEQEEKAAAAFRPYILISLDAKPQPFHVFALCFSHQLWVAVSDNITEQPFNEEIATVLRLAKARHQKYDGRLMSSVFDGFVYNRRYKEELVFDKDYRLKFVRRNTDFPFSFGLKGNRSFSFRKENE